MVLHNTVQYTVRYTVHYTGKVSFYWDFGVTYTAATEGLLWASLEARL